MRKILIFLITCLQAQFALANITQNRCIGAVVGSKDRVG